MQHFVASLCSIKCSDFYFSLGKKCGAADIEVNTGNTESWPCSFIYAAPVVWRTLIDVSRCWGPWKIEIFIKTWNHGAELIACLEFTAVRGEREREKKKIDVVRWRDSSKQTFFKLLEQNKTTSGWSCTNSTTQRHLKAQCAGYTVDFFAGMVPFLLAV